MSVLAHRSPGGDQAALTGMLHPVDWVKMQRGKGPPCVIHPTRIAAAASRIFAAYMTCLCWPGWTPNCFRAHPPWPELLLCSAFLAVAKSCSKRLLILLACAHVWTRSGTGMFELGHVTAGLPHL